MEYTGVVGVEIIQCTEYRRCLNDEELFDELQWHCDIFRELYFNDALWAYTIHVSEEVWVLDPDKLNDPVLRCLLVMGAWDWDQKDRGELHQANWVMRHATAMASHLLPRILDGETKVKHCLIG